MHELSYSTVIKMLKLSGIPVRANQRKKSDPIIIAGGTSVSSPCPVLPFFDLFVIGDGEEVIKEIAGICIETCDRDERLSAMSELPGVFMPGSGKTPRRRILADLDISEFPSDTVVPNINIIHDRLGVEVARGCTRGCRFCQAGMIYRPYRERSFESVVKTFKNGLSSTGYDNIAMTALSITDLSYLPQIMESLVCPSREISLGVPSMRVEGMTERMADIIASVKKPGFTLAVEAATERLRSVINKGNTEDDLLRSVAIIKKQGWRLIKLYFMIGLPTETNEDIQSIVKLTRKIANVFRGGINVSISTFIPKTFTPFQWDAQMSTGKQDEVLKYLKKELRDKRISLKWTDSSYSLLEGAFSRGDEKLAEVIEMACGRGAYLDGWNDTFKYDSWMRAFDESGIGPDEYLKERQPDKIQPWEFIDMRISREFLLNERQLAYQAAFTSDCRLSDCAGCGVCGSGVANMVKPHSGKTEMFTLNPSGRYPYTIEFSKQGPLAMIGNRDLIEMFKRMVRRAGLKAFYSEGFSPVMKLILIPPTSLGIASKSEFMQLDLCEDLSEDVVASAISDNMPEGAKLIDCQKGKIKQVKSYTYRFLKPCGLILSSDSVIVKGGTELKVMDFVEKHGEDEIKISFIDGRTISPVTLTEAFGEGVLMPSDIVKTETIFI